MHESSQVRIQLITASNKQPSWVAEGYDYYARRLDKRCPLELVEVPLARRSAGGDAARAVEDESRRMLRLAPAGRCRRSGRRKAAMRSQPAGQSLRDG